MSRLLIPVRVAGAVLLLLVGIAVFRALGDAPDPPPLPTAVEFDTPAAIAAGTDASIGISVEATVPITTLEVMVVSGDRTSVVEVPVRSGAAVLELGRPVTEQSGLVSLVAVTRSQAVHSTFVITPGPVVAVDPLAGPRTIVADGADETMVVAVPIDSFGNSMPDGTIVVVNVARPDGTAVDLPAAVDNGIAATRFSSTTLAGPLAIAASSDAARGPAVRVDQVAGRPAPFALRIPDQNTSRPLVADGRTLHTVVTTQLLDEHDNVLPDGVSVDVQIDTPTGPGRFTVSVIAGRAEFQVESPALAGVVRLEAMIDGVSGAPISLDFGPAVTTIPVRLDEQGYVVIGPVLDANGAYVPDGTIATIGRTDATIQNGTARVALDRTGGTDQIVVSVLGATTVLEVPR